MTHQLNLVSFKEVVNEKKKDNLVVLYSLTLFSLLAVNHFCIFSSLQYKSKCSSDILNKTFNDFNSQVPQKHANFDLMFNNIILIRSLDTAL